MDPRGPFKKIPFRNSHKSSQKELNLVRVEASELDLLSACNDLEAFALSFAVQEENEEERNYPIEISSLPNSLNIMEMYSNHR